MKREQVLPQVMADMAQRIANGAKEYGEPLTTHNGRDALQDAYEEALDLALYLKQALMERAASTYPVIVLGKEKLESVLYAAANDDGEGDIYDAVAKFSADTWAGPDWSQAPEWAVWWACAENGICFWFSVEPSMVRAKNCHVWLMQQAPSEMQEAPKSGYTGDWRESLRKRPE